MMRIIYHECWWDIFKTWEQRLEEVFICTTNKRNVVSLQHSTSCCMVPCSGSLHTGFGVKVVLVDANRKHTKALNSLRSRGHIYQLPQNESNLFKNSFLTDLFFHMCRLEFYHGYNLRTAFVYFVSFFILLFDLLV